MGAALGGTGHVPLLLEDPQHGQDGVVRERIGEEFLYFRDRGHAPLPQYLHDVELTLREPNPHSSLQFLRI